MDELPEWTDCIFKSSKWDIKTEKEREEFVKVLKYAIAKYPEKGNLIHEAWGLKNWTIKDIVDNMFNLW
jgi:hypothetical protein